MTRTLTINTSDENGNNKATKYSYIDPNTSDADLYNAAIKISSLSNNSFVSAIVTNSYELQGQSVTTPNQTTTNSFRRV